MRVSNQSPSVKDFRTIVLERCEPKLLNLPRLSKDLYCLATGFPIYVHGCSDLFAAVAITPAIHYLGAPYAGTIPPYLGAGPLLLRAIPSTDGRSDSNLQNTVLAPHELGKVFVVQNHGSVGLPGYRWYFAVERNGIAQRQDQSMQVLFA